MTLYDLVAGMYDKRLPPFRGAGRKDKGKQSHFGKGQGRFFLGACMSLVKHNGKYVASNTAY